MAKQTINSNSVEPFGTPNQGLGTEFGDTWAAAVSKLNAMFTDLYNGAKALVAGTGTAVFGAAGNISTNVTQLGSSATNTTQTLMSYVLPANTLAAAAQGMLITAWGKTAANAAPKTLALNVGGLTVNTGAQTFSGSNWLLTGIVYKTAANAQTGALNSQFGTTLVLTNGTDTSVDTGTINISVTMLDASAGQSNVLQNGLLVEFFN